MKHDDYCEAVITDVAIQMAQGIPVSQCKVRIKPSQVRKYIEAQSNEK